LIQITRQNAENLPSNLRLLKSSTILRNDKLECKNEIVKETWNIMKEQELKFQPNPHYMINHHEINANMRAILIDWLISIHEFEMGDTLFLAVNFLDRYLSIIHNFAKKSLQLLGLVCYVIAAKMEGIGEGVLSDLIYLTDNAYVVSDALTLEFDVLSKLGFSLTAPTSSFFLNSAATELDISKQTFHFAMYLSQLLLLDIKFLTYLPSEIACSTLYISMHATKCNPEQMKKFTDVTGYSLSSLENCIRDIIGCYNAPNRLKTLCEKYSNVAVIRLEGTQL